MEIRTKYESPLTLKEIAIIEGIFRRTEDSLNGIELGIKINHHIEPVSEEEYCITLDITVADDAERIFVFVKCKAKFSTAQENQEMIKRNAIAIMFPYIRSYISIITTQPGMPPIVLPAMNIVAMLNDK